MPSGKLQKLQHGRKRADLVNRIGCRIIVASVLLRSEQDLLIGTHNLFERRDRLLATDEKGDDHVGKNDDVPERENRKQLLAAGFFLGLFIFAHFATLFAVRRRPVIAYRRNPHSFHLGATRPAPFCGDGRHARERERGMRPKL